MDDLAVFPVSLLVSFTRRQQALTEIHAEQLECTAKRGSPTPMHSQNDDRLFCRTCRTAGQSPIGGSAMQHIRLIQMTVLPLERVRILLSRVGDSLDLRLKISALPLPSDLTAHHKFVFAV